MVAGLNQASDDVSARVVEQRLRNRIMEVLEGLVDWRDTLEKIGSHEYFESFFDWFPDYQVPALSTLTDDERTSLSSVLSSMLTARDETPAYFPNDQFEESGRPQRIALIAAALFKSMVARGWFSEQNEEEAPSLSGRRDWMAGIAADPPKQP